MTLENENNLLQNEIEELKNKIYRLSARFSYDLIFSNDELINIYTGLPNSIIFNSLFEMFNDVNLNYYLGWNVKNINYQDQLLLTLMKFKLNFPHLDLAHRFNCSRATVTNIFITWVHALYENLFMKCMNKIPTRNKNKLCLPNSFSSFTNCRIIIDCTEFPTDITRTTQKSTYSNYKHYHTLKALVGVSPNGVVTFCSDLFPGSTSDKIFILHSGLLTQLECGDLILADKGFLIRDILPIGVHLNIPPFLDTPQFTKKQVYLTENIARARIHVERAIRRKIMFQHYYYLI